jgi:hypothetical protein
MKRRLSGFALTLVSLGFILLCSFLERRYSAHVERTFRLGILGPVGPMVFRLLLIFPGLLWAGAVRGVPLRRVRFSLADFLTYALLPLLLALCPVLLSALTVWRGVRLSSAMVSLWTTTWRLQSLFALVAGWTLGFSFEVAANGTP